tara:strand:+ start:3827 stop:6721 length:2895 start_codon:yes stop_codon:yes gene_type:complete
MTKLHQAFKLINRFQDEKLNQTLIDSVHPESGARHLHIQTNDEENVYMVTLKTIPKDHTGVAHILEHLALCGSQHYPVRDPFFMMLRRSLNTYMNASTANDHTSYYYASKNKQDFFNLMGVYNDAVFFPNLAEIDFRQEGHRLALKQAGEVNGGIQFKGVVYNEMKGAMSDFGSQIWQRVNYHLFPETTYRFNSGGEPRHIPDLDYESLCQFYREHYHPENAIFMTAGNISIEELQTQIHDQVLKHYQAQGQKKDVPLQPAFSKHKTIIEKLPSKPQVELEAHHIKAWLLPESSDLKSWLLGKIAGAVLVGDSAAPLMHALETTQLGRCPSSLTGVFSYFRQMTLMVGLEQSKVEHQDAFVALVDNTLRQVVEGGIDQKRLEGVFNRFELQLRNRSSGMPHGLQLIHRCLGPALHGGPVESFLFLNQALSEMRESVLTSSILTDWMREWFLDNPHQLVYTGLPDESMLEKQSQDELERLALVFQSMTPETLKTLDKSESELEVHQQSPQDENVLPKIDIREIPTTVDSIAVTTQLDDPIAVDYYRRLTNGLVYQRYVMYVPQMDKKHVQLLGLYADCISEIGAGHQTYLETQAQYSYYTGGIDLDVDSLTHLNTQEDHIILSINVKSLHRYAEEATKLLSTMWHTPHFDELDRIRELISQIRSSEMESVAYHGHRHAMSAAWGMISNVGDLHDQIDGLSYIQFVKQLDDSLNTGSPKEVVQGFKALADKVQTGIAHCLVVSDDKDHHQITSACAQYFPNRGEPISWQIEFEPRFSKLAWIADLQVNYCAKAYVVARIDDPLAPALSVLSQVLTNGFLHRVIREQGGAYGGGVVYRPACGSFVFFSYRDPRHLETLQSFSDSLDWLFEQQDLASLIEEAIISEISKLDKPESPIGGPNRIFSQALWGLTQTQRANYRRDLLNVTQEQVRLAATQFLKGQAASQVVLTGAHCQETLTEAGFEIKTL